MNRRSFFGALAGAAATAVGLCQADAAPGACAGADVPASPAAPDAFEIFVKTGPWPRAPRWSAFCRDVIRDTAADLRRRGDHQRAQRLDGRVEAFERMLCGLPVKARRRRIAARCEDLLGRHHHAAHGLQDRHAVRALPLRHFMDHDGHQGLQGCQSAEDFGAFGCALHVLSFDDESGARVSATQWDAPFYHEGQLDTPAGTPAPL